MRVCEGVGAKVEGRGWEEEGIVVAVGGMVGWMVVGAEVGGWDKGFV